MKQLGELPQVHGNETWKNFQLLPNFQLGLEKREPKLFIAELINYFDLENDILFIIYSN